MNLEQCDANVIYRHLVNCRMWKRIGKDHYIRLTTSRLLSFSELKKLQFPVRYKAFPFEGGEFYENSIISSTDAKYWQMATYVISEKDPNIKETL